MFALMLLLFSPPIEQNDYEIEAPAAEAVAEEGPEAAAGIPWPAGRSFIGTAKDGGVMFARTDTRRRTTDFQLSTDSVEMWVDTLYSDGRERKTLWRFKCKRRTLALVSFIEYDKSGEVITQHKNKSALPWSSGEDVVPDTIGEEMHTQACAE